MHRCDYCEKTLRELGDKLALISTDEQAAELFYDFIVNDSIALSLERIEKQEWLCEKHKAGIIKIFRELVPDVVKLCILKMHRIIKP